MRSLSFSRDAFPIDKQCWSLMRDGLNCSLLMTLCLSYSILYVSKPQMGAYVFFYNWKSIGCIHNFFLHCTYYTLLLTNDTLTLLVLHIDKYNGVFFVLQFNIWYLCLSTLNNNIIMYLHILIKETLVRTTGLPHTARSTHVNIIMLKTSLTFLTWPANPNFCKF